MIIQDAAGQVLSIGDHVVFTSRLGQSPKNLECEEIIGFTQRGYVEVKNWRGKKTIQSSTSDLIKIPAEIAASFGTGRNTVEPVPSKSSSKSAKKVTI